MIAVMFKSNRTNYSEGFGEFNEELENIAQELPGFIQQDNAREMEDIGMGISYWKDATTAREFKPVSRHIEAQQKGRIHYYDWCDVKVCPVDRPYNSTKQAEKE